MLRAAVVVIALLATASGARADELRVVVDRVELEPATITGQRLRVFLSALSLEGQRLDLTDQKSIKLYVGSSEKHIPYALGTFDSTGEDLALVVIVQVSLDFGDALPTITDTLDRELLATLGEHAQVAVIAYGDGVTTGKLDKPKAARGKLSGISSDGSAGDPGLLDAIDRALGLLRHAKPADRGQGDPEDRPLRKLVIVIGDGRDRAGDRDRITAAGKRAAKDGVRIHAVAYSPADVRRPLLALGELAKQSLGTFRWPGRGRKPGPESWTEAFKQLHDEILKQYVVTFFVNGDDDVAGKKLHIVASLAKAEATSNEVKVPDSATCPGGAACDTGYCAADRCVAPGASAGRGWLHWLLVIGGIAVGGIVALGFIGFLMSKRQPRPKLPVPFPVPGQPPMPGAMQVPMPVAVPVQAPGLLPNGRPIPALLVVNGPYAGRRFTLRNGFVIGKQPGCDLQIDDGFTSGQHAMIAMDGNGNCRLYDRGSTNGTFVNGVPVRDVELTHAIAIKIGSTELRFLAQ